MANETYTMPYNADAEMALIGCLLMDNEVAIDIIEKLSAEDFYKEAHQIIIRAMKEVFNARNPIDIVTVSDQLDSKGELGKADQAIYQLDQHQAIGQKQHQELTCIGRKLQTGFGIVQNIFSAVYLHKDAILRLNKIAEKSRQRCQNDNQK